ncbi:MAG: ribonuclease HI [Eubacteriales bacterium]|nr:ribonuclease HI [Eubacteriales bacterium]
MDKDKIIIYTDGACSNNQSSDNIGGYGAILTYKDHTKEIFGGRTNTTNNIMELTAMIEALKLVKNRMIETEVHSDSAYIVNCINLKWYEKWKTNNWKNSKKDPVKNKELWEELIDLIESFNDIKIIKVKGHSGIDLNEKADELANKGIESVR